MEPGPDACLGPLGQAAPTGHARAETELLRQVFPGDPGVQHEHNALEHQRVRMPHTPGMASATLNLRQQLFGHRPQLVYDTPRLWPSHPTPTVRHFRSDPTTPKIIPLGVPTGQPLGLEAINHECEGCCASLPYGVWALERTRPAE